MRLNKLLLFVVLIFVVCVPFATAVQFFGPTDTESSLLTNQFFWEEYFLYGGILPADVGIQDGEPCIKPGAKPGLRSPDPVDTYLVPLGELQLPQYGFAQDVAYLQAQNARLHEIIGLVDNAIQDDSVQQYKVFADDPLYENTAYGMYFSTIYDSLVFGGEAVKIIGLLHDSATNGAIWLNYGFITDSGDIRMAFDDYIQTNLLFNGLLGQMEEYGYLEESVEYAAGVLGSQMQQQAEADNNIFQAHQNLNIAGDSMDRAQDYFDIGDAAGAVNKGPLEQKMDFFGLMNMAEGLYSMGESYKLKMLVLFMLIDGTFRGGLGLREKLGAAPGPPCDEIPAVCPVSSLLAPPPSHAEQCCKGCPPGFYIIDNNNMECFGLGAIKPGTPGYFPTPGGSPGPSMLPGSGGAVAALAGQEAGDTEGLFPVFDFDRDDPRLPDLDEYLRIAEELNEKYKKLVESIPSDFKPALKVVVQENVKSVDIAKDAFIMAADKDLKITPEAVLYNGAPVTINRQTGELVNSNGVVVKDLGKEFAHDFVMFTLAEKRLKLLNQVLDLEYKESPLYEKDRQDYLAAKAEELTTLLDAMDRRYKYEVTNLRADPDLSFEIRNDKINELYGRTNQDLIKAIESTITDEGVRRFTYLILDKEEILLELLDQRSKTADYNDITAINIKILEIVYPDTGIAGYYEQLKAQNMPFEGA